MYTNLNIETLENEIWIPIPSYESNYLISNYGRIKSIRYNKIRRQKISKDGYLHITLSLNDKLESFVVHRLVYHAFCSNPTGLEIDHIDGNRKNNRLENLQLCTHTQNCNNPLTIEAYKNRDYSSYNFLSGSKHSKARTLYAKNTQTGVIQSFPTTYAAGEYFSCQASTISYYIKHSPKVFKNHVFSYTPFY